MYVLFAQMLLVYILENEYTLAEEEEDQQTNIYYAGISE